MQTRGWSAFADHDGERKRLAGANFALTVFPCDDDYANAENAAGYLSGPVIAAGFEPSNIAMKCGPL